MRKASFAPVADKHCRLLILGSLPGEESLRQRQYYAHPQNRFWELVGSAIGTDLRALDYQERLRTLLARRIGLWDVIAGATREGSLDSAIRNATGNDLAMLAKTLPELTVLAFNGRKAAMAGRKQLAGRPHGLRLIDLPSSSPAYAAMPYDEKCARWAVIGDILTAAPQS